MLSKLAKNAIIRGPLESFCVVCECRLDNCEKIHAHLEDETHDKKLASYPHLQKYDGDHIRKIKSIYFCEFCSVILHSTTKVNVHVRTKQHLDRKGSHKLRPGPNNGVLAFDGAYITENAWHSIKDDGCSICGVELNQMAKHKMEPSHLLKLAQIKVEFVENGLYRKIDENIFQCLTCDCEYDNNILNDHFESNAHMKVFINSKLDNNAINIKNDEDNSNKVIKIGENDKTKIETGARPKDKPADAKNDIKQYAKDNNITYNTDQLNAYCRVCEIRMPATFNSLKEHVSDSKHANKLRLQRPRLTKQLMNTYVDDMLTIQGIFHQDVVINRRICVSSLSFMVMAKNSDQLRCYVCDMNVNDEHMEEHIKISRHRRAIGESFVVTTFDDEFLREIRPGTFHCGYCNIIILKWEEVVSHLDIKEHKLKKASSQCRFREHLPQIREKEERQKLGLFLRMLHGQFM